MRQKGPKTSAISRSRLAARARGLPHPQLIEGLEAAHLLGLRAIAVGARDPSDPSAPDAKHIIGGASSRLLFFFGGGLS